MIILSMKPIKRSSYRIMMGKIYFRLKRYIEWVNGSKTYALSKSDDELQHLIYSHKTILRRELKDVDMQLQHNKIHNLNIATKKLHKVLIKPGETFSYWRLIGKPTKQKGYVEGMILHYGEVKSGVGGGLCQLSNLIYWMTLHTPLTVTERYRHSYDVFPDSNRTQPFGSGATCFYNYLDLQIKNETNDTYQLIVYLTNTHLVGEWHCNNPILKKYEVYEEYSLITFEYWGSYIRHNTIRRKVFNLDNKLIDDQFITENHAIMMYEPFIETNS